MKNILKLAVFFGLASFQSAVFADTFAEDYADAAAQLNSVDANLTALNSAVTANTEHFNTELRNTNTALNSHAQAIAALNTELTNTNTALTAHGEAIDSVNTELQNTNAHFNTELQKTNEVVVQNAQALASLNASMASNRADFARLDRRIDNLTTETRSAIAGIAAMSALVPNARAEGNTQIAVGAGTYRDEAGVAVGAFHYVNDNVLLNTAASYSHDNYAGRAGITFGW